MFRGWLKELVFQNGKARKFRSSNSRRKFARIPLQRNFRLKYKLLRRSDRCRGLGEGGLTMPGRHPCRNSSSISPSAYSFVIENRLLFTKLLK